MAGSFLLHAAVLVVLIFSQPIQVPMLPKEEPIRIEIIIPTLLHRPTVSKPAKAQTVSSPGLTVDKIIAGAKNLPVDKFAPIRTAGSNPAPDTLIAAKKLCSDHVLADRHNRSARAAMKTPSVDERISQLCNVEAIEQVRRARAALRPDYVIAYAMAVLKLFAHEVDAEGGAFLNRRSWYGLKFRCGVSIDDSKVTSSAFLVGQLIPKSQ